jgi:hypothetical protein
MRLRHGVEHLHRLGPRATCKFLIELLDGRDDGIQAALDLLAKYRRITPQMILAAGGDRFPPHLREVPWLR